MMKRLSESQSTKSLGDAQLANTGIDLENEQCVDSTYVRNKLMNDSEYVYGP